MRGPQNAIEIISYNRALVDTLNDRVSYAFLDLASEVIMTMSSLLSCLLT
jgi:hypothetical protein